MRTKLTEFVCKQYLQKIVDACYLDVYPLSSQKINVQLCFTILRISLFSLLFLKNNTTDEYFGFAKLRFRVCQSIGVKILRESKCFLYANT